MVTQRLHLQLDRLLASLLLVIGLYNLTSATDSVPITPEIPEQLKLLGVTSTEPVRDMNLDKPGWYRLLPPPNGLEDPIDPLGTTSSAVVTKGLKGKELTAFVDGYVDRIEQHYSLEEDPDLKSWLGLHPGIRKDFWLAISPQFDDAAGAMKVLNELRLHNTKAVEKFSHLAIAMAVVFDVPQSSAGSRYSDIFGISREQFTPTQSPSDIFDFFTSSKYHSQFVFTPDLLPWPVLVHLVDLDVSADDIAWAHTNCIQSRTDIGSLYKTVPYDYDKLGGRSPKLGDRPYSLENLQKYGGVCGDQAHFTSRVAKCFGIPAMKVGGMGRYGATSAHAWCGFLTAQKGRPILEFTGRYDFDFYYTGDVYDPQTRTIILDRTIEMQYDGLSLSYEKYRDSQVLSRAGSKTLTSDPSLSVSFACQAIERNTYNPIAWRVLSYQIAHNALSRSESAKWSNRMMKDLASHPDLTLECLPSLMAPFPVDKVDERQRLYNAAFQLYSQRPDLQIRLRIAQCSELAAHAREKQALGLSLETCLANAKEGSLILPLVDLVVSMSKQFAHSNSSFQLDVVKEQLGKIDAAFPQKRGNDVSQSYLDFKKAIRDL